MLYLKLQFRSESFRSVSSNGSYWQNLLRCQGTVDLQTFNYCNCQQKYLLVFILKSFDNFSKVHSFKVGWLSKTANLECTCLTSGHVGTSSNAWSVCLNLSCSPILLQMISGLFADAKTTLESPMSVC